MEAHVKLRPGQPTLTSAQAAEAERFAHARISAQLSTEPVDEGQAEALLHEAYQVAGLAAPPRLLWLDGPLELVSLFLPRSARASVWTSVGVRVRGHLGDSVYDYLVQAGVGASAGARVAALVRAKVQARVQTRVEAGVQAGVQANVEARVHASVEQSVYAPLEASVWESVEQSLGAGVPLGVRMSVSRSVWAYQAAPWLAGYRFFDTYLEPNELQALAQFNELVSGYWLGTEIALLVRRPRRLARGAAGRLHCATGTALEYADGWGLYAWQGVRVPGKVIRQPEDLTGEDWRKEPNGEVRRVIQERMGERLMHELGGKVIESGPRGTLYEVRMPEGDPEPVGRFVQVQDASTPRQYFLRVPPWVETAEEAVAWGFQRSVQEYAPGQEA